MISLSFILTLHSFSLCSLPLIHSFSLHFGGKWYRKLDSDPLLIFLNFFFSILNSDGCLWTELQQCGLSDEESVRCCRYLIDIVSWTPYVQYFFPCGNDAASAHEDPLTAIFYKWAELPWTKPVGSTYMAGLFFFFFSVGPEFLLWYLGFFFFFPFLSCPFLSFPFFFPFSFFLLFFFNCDTDHIMWLIRPHIWVRIKIYWEL